MNYDKYRKFAEVNVIESAYGYLVWRYGTADNVEIFDIEVVEKRKSHGTELIKSLLEKFKDDKPAMIFGFTRQGNSTARSFYTALGFNLVPDIEDHCIFWQIYNTLHETLKSRKY